jgi:hypothetical protein
VTVPILHERSCTFANGFFEQCKHLLDVPVGLGHAVLARTAKFSVEGHSSGDEGDIHDVAKLLLEAGVVIEQLGDESQGDLPESCLSSDIRCPSSSRLDMIFLKSFLLREAKISSWFLRLTTIWLCERIIT